MSYGLHIIKNPAGSYSYVGSLPRRLGKQTKPTASDIMAGRFYVVNDIAYTTKFPVFQSKADAVNHAEKCGCDIASIALV